MSRFKVGDGVLVSSAYRRLYPDSVGIVLSVKPDAFGRSAFDEYLVEFSPKFRKLIFDFRLTHDNSAFQTINASSVEAALPDTHLRRTTSVQTVLQTPEFDIHLATIERPGGLSLLGQILEKRTARFLTGVEVRLFQEDTLAGVETADELGEFWFSCLPAGTFSVEIVLGPNLTRILGTINLTQSKTA
jgi:hypothetical protein